MILALFICVCRGSDAQLQVGDTLSLSILNLPGEFNPLQAANCCRNFRHVVD